MKKFMILASALAISVSPLSGEALQAYAAKRTKPAASREDTYVVAKGDTVGAIADRLGLSQAAIIELNGLKKPYALSLGKVLKLPASKAAKADTKAAPAVDSVKTKGKGKAAAADLADDTYTVAKGDTVGIIAKRLKVEQSAIIELNGLKKPYALSLGKVLKVPGSTSAKPEAAPDAKSKAPEPTVKSKSASVAKPAPAAKPVAAADDTYTVAKGDTVGIIAKRLKVEQGAIIEMNGLKKPYALSLGKVLKVPSSPVSKAQATAPDAPDVKAAPLPKHVQGGQGVYVVAKGDTVATIAKQLGISKDAIIKLNRLKKPYALSKGKVLKVPAQTVYVVQPGDNYYDIAHRFGVGTDVLKDLNTTEAGSALHPGQKLQLPPEVQQRLAREAAEAERAAAEKAAAQKAAALKLEADRAAARETVRLAAERNAASKRAADRAEADRAEQARLAAAQPFSQPLNQPVASPSGTAAATPAPVAAAPAKTKTLSTLPASPVVLPPKPVANGASPPSAPPARTEPRPVTLPSAPATATLDPAAPPSESEIAASGRGRFIWPVRGDVVSNFGIKPGGQRNDGINLSGKDGDPVRAAASGEVVYSGNLVPGFGNLVLIKHEGGWVTAYAHMASTMVKIKDRIAQGQTIGTVGRTGGVEQSQLHFELRFAPSPKEKARPVDPSLVMPR